jgi:Tol biopolymer transport system component
MRPPAGHLAPQPPSTLAVCALLAGCLFAPPISLADPAPVPPAGTTDASAAEAAPAWDVENPPGERSEVPIDTTTGTWMSVDVAPDGERLVFDLLGDLYLLPITGGEATRLTAGLAWDEQPRFSPDGKSIAFTSDRAGGDNLWILRLDVPGADGKLAGAGEPVRGTSDPRLVQVTKESFRLLNSPAWSPDGEYLVGRKHFTSQRSAGAGEIWIYHRSGGDGLQIVPRRNDQKDIGEPAFSPDGRYVYYSHDATPGDVFEYSKDPNGEIYAIDRVDRETGEVERWLGGPGGAIRPTLSPDGKWLAYIRRVRYRSVLMLHDQQSGIDRPLWDGLDRDLQETWAIHGVYPGMDFLPDSRALVVWAGGQLHRVDITTGERQVIPFHVADTRTVTPALRFPIAVAPDEVPLRMLRWVRVAPDGSRVIYQALGKLWVRDLPDGKPRRLATAAAGEPDVVELFPSFSRDGRYVVYTTWNDEHLGTVRAVPAAGGAPLVLVDEPGHYVEPVLSPQN